MVENTKRYRRLEWRILPQSILYANVVYSIDWKQHRLIGQKNSVSKRTQACVSQKCQNLFGPAKTLLRFPRAPFFKFEKSFLRSPKASRIVPPFRGSIQISCILYTKGLSNFTRCLDFLRQVRVLRQANTNATRLSAFLISILDRLRIPFTMF